MILTGRKVYIMTRRSLRKYDKDFKVTICKMVLENNISIADIGKQYAINIQIIYRWVDEYKTFGNDAFVGRGKLRSEDAKIKKLIKERDEALMEVEILKKTAIYFLDQQKKE